MCSEICAGSFSALLFLAPRSCLPLGIVRNNFKVGSLQKYFCQNKLSKIRTHFSEQFARLKKVCVPLACRPFEAFGIIWNSKWFWKLEIKKIFFRSYLRNIYNTFSKYVQQILNPFSEQFARLKKIWVPLPCSRVKKYNCINALLLKKVQNIFRSWLNFD